MLRSLVAIGALAFAAFSAHGTTLLLLHGPQGEDGQLQVIKRVAAIYGASTLSRLATPQDLVSPPPGTKIAGVVLTEDLLLAWRSVAASKGYRTEALPLLVIGADAPHASTAILNRLDADPNDCRLTVTGNRDDAFELASLELPCGESPPHRRLSASASAQPIITMHDGRGAPESVVFARLQGGPPNSFALGKQAVPPPDSTDTLQSLLQSHFGTTAAAAIFVRSSLGQQAWHAPARLANVTLDDPWLREPFGGVSYPQLLAAMNKSRFHTTIAFVPWNFDRSSADVVSLFRSHPEFFSVSIHGNNHDHEEFSPSRPLSEHEADLRQALARMKAFRSLTGINVDQVMVFPQQIAAPPTIDLLRRFDFSCTVNLQNRRQGWPSRSAEEPHLWSDLVATDQGAPSLKRELFSVDKARLAMLAFMGAPALLHGHQDSLELPRLTRLVEDINLQLPDTRWTGLGEVCDHLYLLRSKSDELWEMKLFGTRASLANTSLASRHFDVTYATPKDARLAAVLVDGQPTPHLQAADRLRFSVLVPARSVSKIHLVFDEKPVDIASESTAKTDLRVRLLRYGSDFRDIVLPQSYFGRQVHSAYYYVMKGRYEQIERYVVVASLMLFALLALIWLAVRRRWTAAQ
jgi:hypothetical protein